MGDTWLWWPIPVRIVRQQCLNYEWSWSHQSRCSPRCHHDGTLHALRVYSVLFRLHFCWEARRIPPATIMVEKKNKITKYRQTVSALIIPRLSLVYSNYLRLEWRNLSFYTSAHYSCVYFQSLCIVYRQPLRKQNKKRSRKREPV